MISSPKMQRVSNSMFYATSSSLTLNNNNDLSLMSGIGKDYDKIEKNKSKNIINVFKAKSSNELSTEPSEFTKFDEIQVSMITNHDQPSLSDLLNSTKSVDKMDLKTRIARTASMPILSRNHSHKKEMGRKFKRGSSKLTSECQRNLKKLIKFLHTDTPIVVNKHAFDEEDLKLLKALDHPVDLDKYLVSNEKKSRKSLKFSFTNAFKRRSCVPKDLELNDELSSNGYRQVRRFGVGIPDGCMIPLSLKSEKVKPLISNWTDIEAEADEALNAFESVGRNRIRRKSLMQQRILFISPQPATGWEKVWQTGHCLPLRRWTSEMFFQSKESNNLLDEPTKRNLRWNASVDDFRDLNSSNGQFESDFCQPVLDDHMNHRNPLTFRRNSCNEGIWSCVDLAINKKREYEERITKIRTHLPLVDRRDSAESSSADSALSSSTFDEVSLFKTSRRTSQLQSLAFSLWKGNEDVLFEGLLPGTIARELTTIDRQLFSALNSVQISKLILRPHSVNQENCPDITALLEYQKRIIQLFVTFILQEIIPEGRAKRIALLVEVSLELKLLRNWFSVYSILACLSSPPIARLRTTWQCLSFECPNHYIEYMSISEYIENDFKYKLDYTEPCIPIFIDLITSITSRCVDRLDEIKDRIHGHWPTSKTIATWISDEVETLEKMIAHDHDSDNQLKKEKKRKLLRIFDRLKKFHQKKAHNKKHRKDLITDGEEDVIFKKVLYKSKSSPARMEGKGEESFSPKFGQKASSNQKSFLDFPKLKFEDEREMMKEIATELTQQQKQSTMFYDWEHNELANMYLRFQPYDNMEINMEKSFMVEPPAAKTVGSERDRVIFSTHL